VPCHEEAVRELPRRTHSRVLLKPVSWALEDKVIASWHKQTVSCLVDPTGALEVSPLRSESRLLEPSEHSQPFLARKGDSSHEKNLP